MRLNHVLSETIDQNATFKKENDFLQHKVISCEKAMENRKINILSSEKSINEFESKSKIDICEGKIKGL